MKSNTIIRELRKITGQTQGEFAAMIGASKDAVASWEIGRSNLSRTFARRIACATGVDGQFLLSGHGALLTGSQFDEPRVFTAEDFKHSRETCWGRSDEEGARNHLKHCMDALTLILMAAAKPGSDGGRGRLPGVLDSFMQWCEGTREDFQLGPQIDEQLAKRTSKMGLTQTYREWRRMHKDDPAALTAVGFKDNPQKSDTETLRLEMEVRPGWKPGYSMKMPRPACQVAVIPKEQGPGGKAETLKSES